MPGRFEMTPTLAKIWHAPDHIRIMDPLPPMHRRGIIAGALLVVIGHTAPLRGQQHVRPGQPRRQPRYAVAVPAAIVFTAGYPAAAHYLNAYGERRRSDGAGGARAGSGRAAGRAAESDLSPPPQQQQQSAPASSSSGAPIASSQGKPWPSCSATIICRQPTFTRWPRSKVRGNRSARCKPGKRYRLDRMRMGW
ncbi:Uncharacterised protein [Raoultella terrigena]|uniref:Opacity-associated protein A-like N-terminal domain-containing protein n=1 Tax=Raoultella terrigena TaxID=577 RepID=A0A4U9D4J5_RAOTE|nr:Uncharacterised protein [Raoultella terrigena]